MPGVLQIEALAQVGGLLILNTLEEPEKWSTYFLKLDGVKFRQKVVPGDTLLFKVELLAPIRHGISSMKGYAFVGENCVMEATELYKKQTHNPQKSKKHTRNKSLQNKTRKKTRTINQTHARKVLKNQETRKNT